MKIAILTQTLLVNYGGLLQAAALQAVLRELGHEPVTLRYSAPRWLPQGKAPLLGRVMAKLQVRKWLLRLRDAQLLPSFCGAKLALRGRAQQAFTRRFIAQTHRCNYPMSTRDLKRIGAEAWVVGSDQVWRYAYVQDKPMFFLNFLGEQVRAKSVAYAASFGSDTWEMPETMTEECRCLAHDFRAISVREHSGVDLCRKYLGAPAVVMPDPTMLLSADDYKRMAEETSTPEQRAQLPQGEYIAYYLLDKNEQMMEQLQAYAQQRGLPLYDMMADVPAAAPASVRANAPFRPVHEWLLLAANASVVVSDSFHGSVFSMIFQRPLVCLGNAARGMARFDALAQLLGLQFRISPAEDAALWVEMKDATGGVHLEPRLAELRQMGRDFLRAELGAQQ